MVFVLLSQKSAGTLKWISSDIQWPQSETAVAILVVLQQFGFVAT